MLKFTEDHEWVRLEGDEAVVGITEHAAEQLGDLVFVDLPEKDTTVTKGEEIVTVESVKAASDISSPLDGTISEVNSALTENPTLVNESPMDEGWIFKLKVESKDALDGLMDEAAYREFIA